jgi:ABC-2 type transport system ATP-binding protein
MAEPPIVLQAEAVGAGYGSSRIIHSVDLQLRAGACLGLLGANGSGKSTLLRALTGQIPLLQGYVLIAGIDLAADPQHAKRHIGYAVESADLPQCLTARQYLELVASIRACRADAWPCGDLLTPLSLHGWLDTRIADCSLGTRMKISLAAALLGGPELLILDETLSGLDPRSNWRIRRILTDLVRVRGCAIILCSHATETIALTCTQAAFLEHGCIAHRWGQPDLAAGPAAFEARVMHALGEYSAQPCSDNVRMIDGEACAEG